MQINKAGLVKNIIDIEIIMEGMLDSKQELFLLEVFV